VDAERSKGCFITAAAERKLATVHFRRRSTVETWQCVVCGFLYEEEHGIPGDGIAPGTALRDIPATWRCPDCGVGTDEFEPAFAD